MAECILGAGLNRDGYSDHRRRWIDEYGQPAAGLELHHTCGVRACINLDHLVLMPRAAHLQLHVEQHTTCRKGHEYDGMVNPTNGRRTCRVCTRENNRRYKARKREAARG